MQTSFKRREARRPAQHTEDDQKAQDHSDFGHSKAVGEASAGSEQTRIRTLGLRPSPFPSPTPLFSSGLASFDDLINGHGIPSSSFLTLCPALGLTSLSAEAGIATTDATQSASRRKVGPKQQIDQAAKQKQQLKLAQGALNDLACYGIAQGSLAGHDNLIVAHDVKRFVADRLPSYLSGRYRKMGDGISQQVSTNLANKETTEEEEMKIAFRYAHRPQFKTTVAEPEVLEKVDGAKVAEEHRYCAPLDMATRWSAQGIEQSQLMYGQGHGGIRLVEAGRYADTFDRICAELRPAANGTASQRPVRIHLFDLGGEAWSRGPSHESMEQRITSLTKFVLRIRGLLKASTLDATNGAGREAICTAVISPQILLSPWRTLVTQHLLRFTDIHVLLSDFSCDDNLRRAYSAYAGSVTLVKGPAIGAGLAPGEHRSILRGGVGESGAENDVGWRQRKRGRGIVLETLHEDVDAAVKDDQSSAVAEVRRGDDIEETGLGLPRRRAAGKANHPHHHHSPSGVSQGKGDDGEVAVKMPNFRGLASLRERGLQATRLRKQQEDQSASKP